MGKRAVAVLAALAVLALVGCRPRFPVDGKVTVTPVGNGHLLVWPAAVDPDSTHRVVSYRLTVDGTTSITLPAAARSCLLTGLSAGNHTVDVTATDDTGLWSGEAPNYGTVSGQVTAAAAGTGGVRCASTSRWGYTDAHSRNPSMSADGRYVAFESATRKLHAGDTTNGIDVFLLDRTTDAVTPITPGFSSADSTEPDISANGRYVVFQSTRSDLIPGSVNARQNLFVWDRTTGALQRITDAPASATDLPAHAEISADGSVVAYERGDTDPTQGGSSQVEIWTWVRTTGANTKVTDTDDGARNVTISDDGRHLAFASSTVEVAWDQSSPSDLYTYDRTTGTTTGLPKWSGYSARYPVISGDGSTVGFVANKWDGINGRYLHRLTLWARATGTLTDASDTTSVIEAYATGISADGRSVSYQMRTGVPTPNDTAGPDVFLYDRSGGVTTQVTDGAKPSYGSVLSADGRVLAFDSSSRFLPADDTTDWNDIFVFDRTT